MDSDRMSTFKAQMKQLAKITVSRAEVIACTLATASTPIITASYGFAEGLIIDEAARVSEPMMWPIMDKYSTLNWKILVGDPNQLPPVIKSGPSDNPFTHQLRLSQMQRLRMAGAATAFLPEQARALPQIADAYNKVIYENKQTHIAQNRAHLPTAGLIARFTAAWS
jgi:superfamily I DNA and/or RNA helicase